MADSATAIEKRKASAEVVPHRGDEAVSLLSVIERAATDPKVDVSKMEKLLEMHERITERQAQQLFHQALVARKKAMPLITKNRRNDQTRSRYADLAQVSEEMDPIITAHGFSLSFGTSNSHLAEHYRVTCTLSHEAGHAKDYHADI